jgi:ABC-2 type transport system ATP-binding protein
MMNAAMPIAIEHLSKSYRGKKGRWIEALKGLNLSVAGGEVFGFLGPNGSGKSTTIKTLVGQIRPSGGAAYLFGQPTGSPEARRHIGYLPENPAFYDFLTATEYLEFVGRLFYMPLSLIRRRSQEVLGRLALDVAANRPIRGYSKGMVQRLGLAQALLHDPNLYLLDEPMSGLDPLGRTLVKEIIVDLRRQGKTVFFSTHVIADVEAVCDRVGILAAGELKAVHDVVEVLRTGIVGYLVRITASCTDGLSTFPLSAVGADRYNAVVPKERFQDFTELLFACGGQIELIETQRRSLETLFLETIGRTP